MKQRILTSINQSIKAMQELTEPKSLLFIQMLANDIKECFERGNKILIAGNGGSLCDACHFAEELSGYFRQKRAALAAIALSDPGHLTCVANDSGFEKVFSRAIEALGKPDDLFIALTTSGNSPNLIQAIDQAKKQHLKTACLLGKGGGLLRGKADRELLIDSVSTSDRIQEAHMTVLHILVEMVEDLLFYQKQKNYTCLDRELSLL